MHANSRVVTSNQSAIHEQLSALVTRHANTHFKKPIAAVNRLGFERSISVWHHAGSPPLIIDAGCGVGLSTQGLAKAHPEHFVIGIDQSAERLGRHPSWPKEQADNYTLVRANLVDYWRLLHDAGIHPQQHYLLYPNPWPKKPQLARRWHGHPIFPTIIGLGGAIECRSNWKIYIEEFAAALQQLSRQAVAVERYDAAGTPLTPFEEKYHASGHALWRCRAQTVNTFVIP